MLLAQAPRIVLPSATQTHSLWSGDARWSKYMQLNLEVIPIGNITGTVTGGAATANKLTSASTFEISGDVSSNQITFDGIQTGGTTKVFQHKLVTLLLQTKI